jgi:hypothetical protein
VYTLHNGGGGRKASSVGCAVYAVALLQGNIGPADLMNLSFLLHLKALESCQTSKSAVQAAP